MSNPLDSGYTLVSYDIIGSTNEEAKRLAREDASSGTVIWAKTQTAGKGRHGNRWISPPGNLYCSLLLRMRCDAALVSQLTFLTALALKDALPLEVQFKWPNDVLCDKKKLAGILMEASTSSKGKTDWLVIGVGVNIAHHPDDGDVAYPATSLAVQRQNVSPQELLQRFLDCFSDWFARWQKDGFSTVRESWMERAAFIGSHVSVNMGSRFVEGKFHGINDAGELVIMLPGGQELVISAGELFLGKAKRNI